EVKVVKAPLELPGITSVDGEPVDTETDEVCVAAPDSGAELEIIFNDDNNLPEDETTPAPTLPDKYYKVGDAEDATPVKVEGNKGKLVNSDFPAGASEIKISVWYEGYEDEVYEVTVRVLTDVTITADNEGAVAYNAGKVTGTVTPNSADVKISLYEDADCTIPVTDAEGKAIEVNATAAAEGEEATWEATVDLTAYINKSIYAKAVCAEIESEEPAEFKVAEPAAPAFEKVTYVDAEGTEVEATKEEQEDGSVIFYAGSSTKYTVYVNEGENEAPVPADKVLTANDETIEFKTEDNVAEITSWTPAAGSNTNDLTLKYKDGSDNAVATAQIIVDVEAPVVESANGMIGEEAEAENTITNEATAIVGVITDDNKVEGAEVAITITPADAEEGAEIEPIKVKADADGNFTTEVSGLNAGDVVSIVATDLTGNVSEAKEITVTAAERADIVLETEYGKDGDIYVSEDDTKIDFTITAQPGKDVTIEVYDGEALVEGTDPVSATMDEEGKAAVSITANPAFTMDKTYTVKVTYTDPGYDQEGSFQIKFSNVDIDHPVIDETTVNDRSKEIAITTTPVDGVKEVNVTLTNGDATETVAAVKGTATEEADTWTVDITKVTNDDLLNGAGCLKVGTTVKAEAIGQNGRSCDKDEADVCEAVTVVYYEETSIVYVDPAITEINFTAATEDEDAKAFTQLNTEIDVAFTAGENRLEELEATIQGGSFTTATPLEITEITPGNYTATYTGATTLNDGDYTVTVKYIDDVVTDTESIAAEGAEISIDAVNEIYTIDTTGPEVSITGSIVDEEPSEQVTNRSTAVTGTSEPAETEGGKVSLYVVGADEDIDAAIEDIKAGNRTPDATTDTINEDGTWQIDLSEQLEEGQKVVVVAEDPAGNLSDPAQTEVVAAEAQKYDLNIDGTAGALAAPYVNLLPVDGQGKTLVIEGTGKAGEKLDVTVSGVSEHGTEIENVINVEVDSEGKWTVELTNANAQLESRADGSDIKVSVAYTSGVAATDESKTVAYLRVDDTAPTEGAIDQDPVTNRTTEFSGTCEAAEDKFEEPTDEPLANEIGVDAMTVTLYVADDEEGTNAEVLATVTIPAAEEAPAEDGGEGGESGSETPGVEPGSEGGSEGGSSSETPVDPSGEEGGSEGGSNNTWAITLDNPVTEAGKWVYITVTDSAGNVSDILDPREVVMDDTNEEDAVSDPIVFTSATHGGEAVDGFSNDDPTISVQGPAQNIVIEGTAQAGETVVAALYQGDELVSYVTATGSVASISDAGTSIGTDGTWSMQILGSLLVKDGEEYTFRIEYVEEIDGAETGIKGKAEATIVIDNTAPEVAIDEPVTDRDTELTGTAEPGAEVTATITDAEGNETTVGPVTADEDGNWTIPLEDEEGNPIELEDGDTVEVTATDAAGNESEAETTVEQATTDTEDLPKLVITGIKVNGTSATISGTKAPGEAATLTIKNDSERTAALDPEAETFEVTFENFADGKYTAVATYDNLGDEPTEKVFTVGSKPSGGGGGGGSSAVNKPIVIENVSNEDQPTVSGKGEPNKEIEVFMINTKDPNNTNKTGDSIGKTKTDKNGNWSIEYPADLTPIEPGEYKVTAQYTLGENSYTGRTSAKFTVDPSNTAINNENDLLVVQIDNPKYYLNGKPAVMDSAPFIDENDRTMLPVRVVANALGISDADITWDDETKTATFTRADGVVVSCTVGSNVIKVGDQDMVIDTVPVIRNDRIYLPMRALFNAFNVSDAHIIWDGENRTVTVTKEALDDIAAVAAPAEEAPAAE
ncbi:MAG: hypothetical protein IJF98_05305, partial [Firmicutes bacterium]|nr:hypothetical protein [Bacillota bacterium]